MIRHILFDFGEVLINIDKHIVSNTLNTLISEADGATTFELCDAYERGEWTDAHFLKRLSSLTGETEAHLKTIWNKTILDFPQEHLELLEDLKKQGIYDRALLSNTNAMHIARVKETMGTAYDRFIKTLDYIYYSHEMGMRKPQPEIFKTVLDQQGWQAANTLFIDDTLEHIESAKKLGIHTWHLNREKESVLNLKHHL